jgi:hypothetical protein
MAIDNIFIWINFSNELASAPASNPFSMAYKGWLSVVFLRPIHQNYTVVRHPIGKPPTGERPARRADKGVQFRGLERCGE